jgi:hypothetical protein
LNNRLTNLAILKHKIGKITEKYLNNFHSQI